MKLINLIEALDLNKYKMQRREYQGGAPGRSAIEVRRMQNKKTKKPYFIKIDNYLQSTIKEYTAYMILRYLKKYYRTIKLPRVTEFVDMGKGENIPEPVRYRMVTSAEPDYVTANTAFASSSEINDFFEFEKEKKAMEFAEKIAQATAIPFALIGHMDTHDENILVKKKKTSKNIDSPFSYDFYQIDFGLSFHDLPSEIMISNYAKNKSKRRIIRDLNVLSKIESEISTVIDKIERKLLKKMDEEYSTSIVKNELRKIKAIILENIDIVSGYLEGYI